MKYMKTSLANGTHLWKTEDFFALRAEPDDKVEFALHHLQSGKYPEYESVFGSGSSGALTVEEFNAVIDQTKELGNYTYTAETLDICQRFTFEKVGTGDNAYYHILPYLRLRSESADGETTEIKGSYRSEYRLAVVNGAVKVVRIADGEDPASGRWILQKTAGEKYRIFNVAANKALTVENNTLTLTSGTAHILWELKAICLAMEKDYQQYTNTCGAASGKMVVNYLAAYWKAGMLQNGVAPKVDDDAFIEQFKAETGETSTTNIERITKTVNRYLDEQHQYMYKYGEGNTTLQHILSQSLKGFFPAIINIRPHYNLENASEQLPVFGYGYDATNSKNGHFVVVKGLYYNEKEQRYDCVINETHYNLEQRLKTRVL